MSKVPATKSGTIGKGVTDQVILDAPMPDNVEPRIYCWPKGSVEIVNVAAQLVTLRNVGEGASAAYMLVFATPGIQAFERFARAGVELAKAWRKRKEP